MTVYLNGIPYRCPDCNQTLMFEIRGTTMLHVAGHCVNTGKVYKVPTVTIEELEVVNESKI